MKISLYFSVWLFLVTMLFSASVSASGKTDFSSNLAMLRGITATQALKIANQWKWTNKEVKTSLNTKAVVFKFPDGTIKEIPLPADKMVVAVAPYIHETHG